MKAKMTFLLLALIVVLSGCASKGPRPYVGPKSGPKATVNLFAPTIQSSAANSEIDFEIFRATANCSMESLGWVTLTPKGFNKPITVAAGVPFFVRLDYFQTDIVLARNSRGEVKFVFVPAENKTYTVEYKGTGTRFDMDIWEGSPKDGVQGAKVVPLEWNVRNDKVLYRGELNCKP